MPGALAARRRGLDDADLGAVVGARGHGRLGRPSAGRRSGRLPAAAQEDGDGEDGGEQEDGHRPEPALDEVLEDAAGGGRDAAHQPAPFGGRRGRGGGGGAGEPAADVAGWAPVAGPAAVAPAVGALVGGQQVGGRGQRRLDLREPVAAGGQRDAVDRQQPAADDELACP